MTKILPLVMIFLAAGASVVCAIGGDWRMTIYWAAAAALNAAVTF